MFRPPSVPIIRSYLLYTWQLVRFIQVGTEFLQVGTEFQPESPRKPSRNPHEIYQLPRVQLITPDEGHRRCPKHVEFRDKINFGYFMHLVCYLYEAYHDARSLEHKVAKISKFNGVRPVVFLDQSKTNRLLSVEHSYYSSFWYSCMFRSFSTIIGLSIQYCRVRLMHGSYIYAMGFVLELP
jgi:hypothetical protein